MTQYIPVFQTWNMVRPGVHDAPFGGEDAVDGKTSHDVRHRVQQARVERRMTVRDIASNVGCDPGVFAAFERGSGILPTETMKKLLKELGL